MYDTIIIGAGFAGLSAAALLSKKGKKVLVIEKQPYMGGRAFCKEEDGFVWQYGQHSHRLANDGIASELFDKLGEKLDFLDVKDGSAKLFYKNQLFKRPETPFQFLTTKAMSFRERIVFLKFYIKILKSNATDWYDKTLDEFYLSNFNNKNVQDFISFLGFTIMLPDSSKVSAGEVIDFIQRMKKAKVKQGEPVGGAKQVLDKLSSIIKYNDGKINLGEKVTEVIIKDGKASGVKTNTATYEAENIVYAAPLQKFEEIVDAKLFNNDFIYYCKNIQNSAAVNIDFVSDEPLSDLEGGILGVNEPLWVKFQSNIDETIAPKGSHICTWGLLIETGKENDKKAVEKTEKRLREIASICMPGYEKKVIKERKLVMPIVNANMLIPKQSKPHRPEIKLKDINNLFIIGDTTRGDGCSGDISFSSALKLNELI